MSDIVVVHLLSNLDRFLTQCSASSIKLEQTFVCRVDVHVIFTVFKNVRRNKKVYTKCKSEKTPEEGSGLRNSLKMELHVKTVNGLKL